LVGGSVGGSVGVVVSQPPGSARIHSLTSAMPSACSMPRPSSGIMTLGSFDFMR
jgi:hypothetical protein